MSNTPRLDATELEPNQSQPHLVLNSSLRRVEQGASRFVVLDVTLTTPPSESVDGDAYLVAGPATGDWLAQEQSIAYYVSNAWAFIPPADGFEAREISTGARYVYDSLSSEGWELLAAAGEAVEVGYTPTAPADWIDSDPTNVQEALDDLAERIAMLDAGDVAYTPSSPSDWSDPDPQTVAEALDALIQTADGSVDRTQCIPIACSDETTALTTGTAKVTFHMPYAFTLSEVFAGLTTAQASGSIFTVDVNEAGVSILSTKLTIDNTEETSLTAATPPVISDASIAKGAKITIDVDQIGNGTAKGLKVYLIGTKT